ncbi:MAG: peptide chain release factor N(5)-glutamine methyltransferase [Chthonomonadales bacterium]
MQSALARLTNAGVEDPLREARILLGISTGLSREEILRGLDQPLSQDQLTTFDAFITRRENREPLAYIRGTQEFYGREFRVNPSVLIPRPETELLVDFALAKIHGTESVAVIDACTGSGCVGISIAAEFASCNVLCTDISQLALDVAQENATVLGIANQCQFVLADGLSPFPIRSADIIVANPPYISEDEVEKLQPEVSQFEPRIALSGGQTGFEIIERLVTDATRVCRDGAWFALEIGIGQDEQVAQLLVIAGFSNVNIENDLAGIQRVVSGQLFERK